MKSIKAKIVLVPLSLSKQSVGGQYCDNNYKTIYSEECMTLNFYHSVQFFKAHWNETPLVFIQEKNLSLL